MIKNLSKYLRSLKPKYDDDVVDRCNYLLTNVILIICAITVAAKQYVGEPLQCWVPAEFKGGWEQYIENFCFVESTYFVTFTNDIPQDISRRDEHRIQYYQWIPFILILQAFLFLIPRTVWKMFNWQTGLNIQAVIDATTMTKKVGKKQFLKKEAMNSGDVFPWAQQITYVMDFNQRKAKYGNSIVPSSLWKMYVTVLYLFCKALNLLNIVVQLYLLNAFLGMQYRFWGFGILNDMMHGKQWSVSGNFPRVTLCDVAVREIGNTNRKTVQCVLMINMFNEKIFIALWFWLMALGILTSLNLAYWFAISVVPSFTRNFVTSYLTFQNIQPAEKELDYFIDSFIGKDGLTVLRLINDNAGELVAAELLAALWSIYQERLKPIKSKSDYT